MSRVPVLSDLGKRRLPGAIAGSTAVDVESINFVAAELGLLGQPLYLSQEEGAAPAWVHEYFSPDIWVLRTSLEKSVCLWRFLR